MTTAGSAPERPRSTRGHVGPFQGLYTELKARIADRGRTNDAMRAATARLVNAIEPWLERLKRDITDFDAAQFATNEVPDDVIRQGTQLIEAVKYHEEKSGKPLPYTKVLNDELARLIEDAQAARTIAHDAMTALQEHRRTLRSLAMDLNRELIAFRRAVRQVVGSKHRDYQMLRASRTRREYDGEFLRSRSIDEVEFTTAAGEHYYVRYKGATDCEDLPTTVE